MADGLWNQSLNTATMVSRFRMHTFGLSMFYGAGSPWYVELSRVARHDNSQVTTNDKFCCQSGEHIVCIGSLCPSLEFFSLTSSVTSIASWWFSFLFLL